MENLDRIFEEVLEESEKSYSYIRSMTEKLRKDLLKLKIKFWKKNPELSDPEKIHIWDMAQRSV